MTRYSFKLEDGTEILMPYTVEDLDEVRWNMRMIERDREEAKKCLQKRQAARSRKRTMPAWKRAVLAVVQ